MLQTENDSCMWNGWRDDIILETHFQRSVSYKALGLGAGSRPQPGVRGAQFSVETRTSGKSSL